MMASVAMTPQKESRAAFKTPGAMGYYCRTRCFDNGLVMRHVGDRMIISPPLVIKKDEISYNSPESEAAQFATEEADNVLFAFTDGYAGYASSNTRPVKE
jgi:adenosylmethionine-8-amino-7-oxononanoate aminotransferase